VFSFLTDCHLIVDATITVNAQLLTKFTAGSADNKVNEQLFPLRHKLTLPINCLNSIFTACDVAVNHHTQISADRYLGLQPLRRWRHCLNIPFTLSPPPPTFYSWFVVLFVRNYHLNWDGFSHVSALEQNFNPSKDDIERRRRQGNRRATAVAAARRNRVFSIMIFLLYCLSQSF
jgi:hypothetical protein